MLHADLMEAFSLEFVCSDLDFIFSNRLSLQAWMV